MCSLHVQAGYVVRTITSDNDSRRSGFTGWIVAQEYNGYKVHQKLKW